MTEKKPSPLTRRRAIASGVAVAGVAAVTAAGVRVNLARNSNGALMSKSSRAMPTIYLPHGGGPMSYVDLGFSQADVDAIAAYWKTIGALAPEKPRALLVVSAHWEHETPAVLTSTAPPMLYDYYGFPPAAYEIQWPAPGAPDVAKRVVDLLAQHEIECVSDASRGFDHGVFVPLGRAFPDADIPTIQLSLKAGLDPQFHLEMGRALAPLRDEGVLILGSGMSYHNMRGFRDGSGRALKDSEQFNTWLKDAVTSSPAARNAALARWDHAPGARAAHPREEHLIPLLVVAGAAGDTIGTVPFDQVLMGVHISAAHFV